MHFRGLDLNLLVALDALITEKSISRTGEKIHLSQPATSGALARLREYFKDDLLVPVGRKMVLTPLAEELAEPVRQLLLQTDAIIHRDPAFTPAASDRTFRLVMSDYVVATLMSQAVPEIQRQAPQIRVQVLVPGTRTDWIERGDADLMIMPQQYLSPKHPSEPLFEDDFVCIAWAGNTAIQGHSISLRDYLRFGHVVVRFG
jgi:LysR family nod box-dependent transcriptional activator